MLFVELYPTQTETNSLYLIVLASTGVVYRNQCGGTSTEDKEAEGFLVPIGTLQDTERLYDWFWRHYHGACACTGYLATKPDHVRELSQMIASFTCWHCDGVTDSPQSLSLDVDRIAECCEAWVPVRSPYGNGWLTFINSD